jgi:hypothetical protein
VVIDIRAHIIIALRHHRPDTTIVAVRPSITRPSSEERRLNDLTERIFVESAAAAEPGVSGTLHLRLRLGGTNVGVPHRQALRP